MDNTYQTWFAALELIAEECWQRFLLQLRSITTLAYGNEHRILQFAVKLQF